MEVAQPGAPGEAETRYRAFIETIGQLRPRLHRFCARMTGSTMDGEDVVQEALIVAYRKLDSFDDTRPLAPWLFQIAHRRCIDFLRRRQVRRRIERGAAAPAAAEPAADVADVPRAIERLVTRLPPMERACVILKDVLDHSLEEIAEVTGTTPGGVKAALHRGRRKLAQAAPAPVPSARVPGVLRLYVERFNRRDWDGVRALTADDARLRVLDRFDGPLGGAPYFANYVRMAQPWRQAAGVVDGEPVVITWRAGADGVERPDTVARLFIEGGRIVGITDYAHCAWVLRAAQGIAAA